jgi:hypothetical protein
MPDLAQIYDHKNTAEIIKISPKKRDEILGLAQTFVFAKFALNCDGGELEIINSAITQSLLESFVRDKASQSGSRILRINEAVYESALDDFKVFINENFKSFELLQAYWLQTVKNFVNNAFKDSAKIFKTYLIGELCENLFIDNKTAEIVIKTLKDRKFLYTYGQQYGLELLAKSFLF